ncbi:unnamed protein product [Rhodiola kirilowii]
MTAHSLDLAIGFLHQVLSAIVEEVFRGRHSRSSKCKCDFKIKWLQVDHIKQVFTLPAT